MTSRQKKNKYFQWIPNRGARPFLLSLAEVKAFEALRVAFPGARRERVVDLRAQR